MTHSTLMTIAIAVQTVWTCILACAVTRLLIKNRQLWREMEALRRWVMELDESRIPWRERR